MIRQSIYTLPLPTVLHDQERECPMFDSLKSAIHSKKRASLLTSCNRLDQQADIS